VSNDPTTPTFRLHHRLPPAFFETAMTLRRLRTAVCQLAVLGICTTVLPAWAADHDANTCAAGGGGGGSGGGGGGGGSGGGGGGGSGGGGGGGSGGGGSGGGGGGGSGGGGAGGASGGASSSGGSSSGGTGASAGSADSAAAASSVGVGPAANSVTPAHNGGVGLGIRSGFGGVGNGGVGGNGGGSIDAGGDPSGATSLQGARPYSLRAIYFRRDQFRSPADCLTAAYTQRLPLEVCQ
jgi:hypothetical protein